MIDEISERTKRIAEYVSASGATVREASKKFGVSKSTVHKDLTVRLKYIDGELYDNIRKVLDKNRAERHIRGGNATKNKYKETKKERFYATSHKDVLAQGVSWIQDGQFKLSVFSFCPLNLWIMR